MHAIETVGLTKHYGHRPGLEGSLLKRSPFDMVVLLSVILIAMTWALVVFPRRDLAAPS